jgi:hypothetical protein
MSFIDQHDETMDHVDVCSVCNSIEAAVEYWKRACVCMRSTSTRETRVTMQTSGQATRKSQLAKSYERYGQYGRLLPATKEMTTEC